jgi:hypothetical protein
MGKYYKDADQLYEIYGYFLDRLLKDDKIGAKMAKAGIVIKFIYTDPDCEITIDLLLRSLQCQRGCLVQAGGGPFPPFLAWLRESNSICSQRQGETGWQCHRHA